MTLSRRTFLATSSLAAAASMVAADRAIGASTVVASALPKPADSGIDHIIVVMMENRSFDHFLGWPTIWGAAGRRRAEGSLLLRRHPVHRAVGPAVTLASVPVLLWAAWRARAGSLGAHLVSVGILIWLTYGYAHLSIGAPFNAMFITYVSVMSLAGFAMLDGLLRVDVAATAPAFAHAPRRATAWFLAIAGAGIGVLWLSEIIVALPGGLPTNIHLAELPNPTWVLDLGWIIPTALAAALMLRRRRPAGPVIAGAMLVMLLILSLTMLTVVPFALSAGLGADPVVSQQLMVFTVLFTVLGGIEIWLLARARRRLGVLTSSWLRRGWWPDTR